MSAEKTCQCKRNPWLRFLGEFALYVLAGVAANYIFRRWLH